MRKIYSFLLLGLVLSIGNAWADQVTITPTDFAAATSSNYSTTKSGVTAAVTSSTVTADEMRVFKNQTITISSSNTITGITFTCTTNGTAKYGPGCFAALDGYTYDANGPTGTWTGSSNSVTFTASTNQVRITSLVVTYSTGGTPTCAAPTFSPAAGTYPSAQNVTIACSTDGATIYYTLDGSEPTTGSNLYSSAIAITESKTIKAIAVKSSYNNSAVASATYTIVAPSTISAVRAQGTGSVVTQGVVTSYVGANAYIQDANAAICVYGYNLEINVGDEITVSGTLSTYNGLLEITNPTINVLSSGNTVTPTVKTIAEIIADNYQSAGTIQGLLVKIEDATVTEVNGQNTTIAQGNSSIVVRGITAEPAPVVNDVVTLTGNIGCFNAAQIVNPTDVQIAVPVDPVINAEDVNLAYDATSGEIAYTISNATGATLTAASTTDWISNIQVAADKVTFTTTANVEVLARKGFITLSYTGALDKVISVMQAAYPYPNYTWDLSEASYNEVEDPDIVTWPSAYATMTNKTGTSATAASNYLGGDANNRNSSRFYKNNIFSLIPTCGYNIICVVFTATSNNYATALKNSSWINATASAEETTVVVTPTDGNTAISATIGGTCGFTEVIVYYEGPADSIIVLGTNGWSTFAANYKFETTATVYKAVVNNDKTAVVLTEVENAVVPAGVGVILKGAQEEDVLISPSAASASDFSGNQLVGVTSAINAPANGYVLATIDQDGITKFHPCNATVTIPANKAYIAIGEATAPSALRIEFAENDATNIMNVDDVENAVKFLENGQLFIKKNGVIYNAVGAVIR